MITIAKSVLLRFADNRGFRQYLLNTSWIAGEQLLRLVAGLFVGIYVARYLGPENFGILSHATAFVALFAAIARLGMDGIMVRELVNGPDQSAQDLGTGFWMMMAASVVSLILTAIIVLLSSEDIETAVYIFIIAAGLLFQPFLVIDYYFQSQVKAKFSSICKTITLGLSSMLKLYLVYEQADLILFVVIILFDQVVLALLLVFAGLMSGGPIFYARFVYGRSKHLLRNAWPLVLTALAITLYMRIDQVMIKHMLGERQVGLYSAAVRIYETWLVIPYVLTVSLLPAILKSKVVSEKLYHTRLVWLFRLVFWLSVVAALIVYAASETLITYTFGPSYLEAASTLNIVMFTAIFAALGSGSARYFVVEKMEKKFAARTAVAAMLNVVLNLLLIPRMGIEGAAVATLFCTFTANYLLDWLDPQLRVLRVIKHRAIFLT